MSKTFWFYSGYIAMHVTSIMNILNIEQIIKSIDVGLSRELPSSHLCSTMEPHYNKDLGTMKITVISGFLLYLCKKTTEI